MRNIPIVTKNLLIVNIVAFLITYILGKDASGGYVLNDLLGLHFFMASDFQVYQLITYMFMHGGFEHIIFNMFALWMFGCVVERVWGPKKFLFYYIACGLGAGLFQELAQTIQFYFTASEQFPELTIVLNGLDYRWSFWCHLWYFVGFWYDISRGTYFHFPIAYSYQG